MSYQKNGYTPVETADASNGLYEKPGMSNAKKWGVAFVAALAVAIAAVAYPRGAAMPESAGPIDKDGKLRLFDDLDRYVMEDFDSKPTFSNFLPSVAGYYGKPVWSFYVNRGQGIASFGTKSKEQPILEFNSANKAYQDTPFVGFRTFIKASRGMKSFFTEPFSPTNARVEGGANEEEKPKRIMYVGTNEMEVKEIDTVNKLTTSVSYFVLPEEDFAALVRRTTFTNDGSSDLTVSVLDGLAKIEPSGGKLDWGLKNMGRTLEGWMGVYHADDTLNLPFYRMSTETSDSAEVKIETAGHYCISFIQNDDDKAELLPIVYDSSKIFGQSTSLVKAAGLMTSSVSSILENPQYGDAKTSSAFAAVDDLVIAPGESVTLVSLYGLAGHVEDVPKIADLVRSAGFIKTKFELARSMISDLTAGVETNTANHLFNGAIKQMFLDNALRGGMPTILGDVDEESKNSNYDEDERVKVFHAFSRIHGDLERDYNAFFIDPTYFSQGPGNFRDVAQNRRNDVTFLPRMGSFDVQVFLSYIQADAYEPLTVEAISYNIYDKVAVAKIAKEVCSDPKSQETLTNVLLGGPFRPGQLFELIEDLNIHIVVDNPIFLNKVLAVAEDTPMAVFGQGYWADHWEYYLDLIEAYTDIYPDGEEALMYDKELKYFFSSATVKSRSEKYVLTYTYDGKSKHVLQLDSTVFDNEKVAEQQAYLDQSTGRLGIDANWQRTEEGVAFKSSPIAKLFLLGALKFATRDAYGMGVEYEGGRPGWNDAMNGLPGMVGSGMPETFEMYEVLKYVKTVVDKFDRPVVIPAELGDMLDIVNKALDDLEASGFTEPEDFDFDVPSELFDYWDVVASARENYRNNVQYYFSGNTTKLSSDELSSMLGRWLEQVEIGMARAMKIGSHGIDDDGTSGIPPAYFSYDVTKWTLNGKKNDVGLPLVNARAMKVGRFPLFLEGPTRYMKTVKDKTVLKDLYQNVLNSGLRDDPLKMYTLSASLVGQSYGMGRMMAFSPGWLENQSIWLHMSYKYYLQLLRGKLYDEFFAEMRGGGMLPFMDPEVYGRSLMECSSFLASSAFPDPAMVGRGFLARLSGSTAEFLSIWKLMFIGPEPFILGKDGEVQMTFTPALPLWLFDDEESGISTADEDGNLTLSFKLFGSITVTYHNSLGTDLFGVHPSSYKIGLKDDSEVTVKGSKIPTKYAVAIRKVNDIATIDAYF
mmetsp:Transcript_26956/g.49027  ORF Transcript_26956/g.49027 Transcript_26956/m.49027 type:complete len:1207 (-) Transcript_26956:170-3790(-)|eukprot:CAMPEP_0198289700 /NCGR_PEP_ID=MMETSP1449-20131203/7804_1 /TAXON_ID=420275 /ORGANISM="Attheya septentrionalis, Strain CCMP2084" /LENGTH=1206 /DNA_ID=CAMNT_0043988075 /DNA_START=68 /DNA_END=3688 /DNA_ORIENTATION=-